MACRLKLIASQSMLEPFEIVAALLGLKTKNCGSVGFGTGCDCAVFLCSPIGHDVRSPRWRARLCIGRQRCCNPWLNKESDFICAALHTRYDRLATRRLDLPRWHSERPKG